MLAAHLVAKHRVWLAVVQEGGEAPRECRLADAPAREQADVASQGVLLDRGMQRVELRVNQRGAAALPQTPVARAAGRAVAS